MAESINGIHHITAVSGQPQENINFYTGILGLRFTKRTVNFDDPLTYHLYYGNYHATPGSSITFFPWANAVEGSPNPGEVTVVQYAIPGDSLEYWKNHLQEKKVEVEGEDEVCDRPTLFLKDPNGMQIELVEDPESSELDTRGYGGIPDAKAIRGFFGATLSLADAGRTAELLREFGWEHDDMEGNRIRYISTPDNKLGRVLDLIEQPDLSGRFGKGSVHHIAFRVPDDDAQAEWREKLLKMGFQVSPVRDRQYFRSIYFREHGGVLFELATDGPGFTKDESLEHLGEKLTLPPWFEEHRKQIEKQLPELKISLD
ncbi:MAG: ring-cleaving dioxygenase [Balneolaceae bacterium]